VRYVAAVDIGGTDIKSALVDENFSIIKTLTTPTPKEDPSGEKTIAAIANLVAQLSTDHVIAAVGMAVLGVFDDSTGVCIWSGNLNWHNLPLRQMLESRLNLPVAAGHDIRTAGLAEWRQGAAQGYTNAIFIAIGTGMSAALILDGKILSAGGYAGEIGHLNINGKYPCVCGKTGCLEAAASALAIKKTYESRTGETNVTTEEIYQLVLKKDATAIEIWSDATLAMARACLALTTILAPESIIFGGGLLNSGRTFLDPISEFLDAEITFQKKPKLEIAHFGSKAGTIGCAILAFDLLKVRS
jgi:glucokinase